MAEQVIKDAVGGVVDPATPVDHASPNAADAPTADKEAANQGRLAEDQATNIAGLAQVYVDRALNFFSHATNETLGACFVGLGASTYLVLGRVGLVLIGVVGGIALHATWEGSLGGAEDETAKKDRERRRRELGLDVVNRTWQWRKTSEDTEQDEAIDTNETRAFGKQVDFSNFDPETAAALNTFTDAVIRDYVHYWYAPVLPGEEKFPTACRKTFTSFVLTLSSHLSRKRPVDMFLDFITNSSSIIIVFLNELSAALNASPNADANAAIDTYLQLKPDSSLARMLDSDQQTKKLSMVAEDILQNYLDSKAYSCLPVHVFLRQILSKLILSMTLDSCSKPEWINGWIVYLLEEGEPELMQAIDASVETSNGTVAQLDGGTVPHTSAAKSETLDAPNRSAHRRNVSEAEDAMDEAMREAKRLTQMIVEEESRKEKERQAAVSSSEDVSASTTQGIATPTSSQGESDVERFLSQDEPQDLDNRKSSDEGGSSSDVKTPKQPFTSFDQILPPQLATAVDDEEGHVQEPKQILTLANAKISLFDDSAPGERGVLRSKPVAEYLIQIEPASAAFPGWMIVRKYADFEVLHEVIRRISVITGVRFTESHGNLPTWKNSTKTLLRMELEKYLNDAVRYQQLAESEGMKRFLEKDQGLNKSPVGGKGFGWPDPTAFNAMGKGMMDVLTKAPKGVAGGVADGGKAFFGGVQNVFGGKKPNAALSAPQDNAPSSNAPPFMLDSYMGSISYERQSTDSIRSRPAEPKRSSSRASVDTQSSFRREASQEYKSRPLSRSSTFGKPSVDIERPSTSRKPSSDLKRTPSMTGSKVVQPELSEAAGEAYSLPPPPSLIDEVEAKQKNMPASTSNSHDSARKGTATPRETQSGRSSIDVPPQLPMRPLERTKSRSKSKSKPAMTEQETQVTVELLFAVITELYTLSSAWNFRRTLLQAAKTFLLRPGNPQLEAIRVLIQESVIDSNASDAGIAALILKTRENSLPTEEELKKWPQPLTDKEKEDLRVKARRLLVERGMPQALTSVMGAAASGEALGKVFDCLQVSSVARSMLFGLMLQALRAIVQ